MFKRMLIILAVVFITSGLFAGDALADPPWPAEVIVMDDVCYTPWLDKEGNLITIWGDGIWKIHEFNNSVTLACHDRVDFDQVATIEQVCGYYPEICNGQGSVDIPGISCYIYNDYVTYDSHFVLNPSGNWTATCHFNENDLP